MRGGNQTSFFQIFSDIRSFVLGGYQALPLTIAGTLLILGLMSSNYAMIFLLLGFLLIVPISVVAMNFLFTLLTLILPHTITDLFKTNGSELCDLIIPFPVSLTSGKQEATLFSHWLAMISFLLSYLLFNAIALMNTNTTIPQNVSEDIQKDLSTKQGLRQTQALMSIVMIVIVGLLLMIGRFRSGCETILGSILTISVFGSIGYGWYTMLSKTGQNRLADIFGIANRLLSPSAFTNEPVACLPQTN